MALVGKANASLGLEQGLTGFGFRFVLRQVWYTDLMQVNGLFATGFCVGV